MMETHNRSIDERSSLMSSSASNGEAGRAALTEANLAGESRSFPVTAGLQDVDGSTKSVWYLILLTLSIGGLQVVWSVELSNGSPYLLSLGMSKSLLAFVWIAGPLSGTLVQPYVGILSDNCQVPWGKRKPFMIGGGIGTIICLLGLAWVREIVANFLIIFGVDAQDEGVKITTIVLATVLMYALDFSINTVQAGIRAFIVDNAPPHQQEAANAWAGRLTGIGNIVGYILGYMDLPTAFPFFGNTQFKVLCVIACFSLSLTLLISCSFIQEHDPRLEGPSRLEGAGLVSFFRQIFKSIRRLPPQSRKVCEVQLAAWVGWFPFLFYATTYIGQLYVNPIFEEHPNLPDEDINRAWEDATRIGTFALLVNSIVTLAGNLLIPLFVVPSYKPNEFPTVITQDGPERLGYDGGNRREDDEGNDDSHRSGRLSVRGFAYGGTSSEPLLDREYDRNGKSSNEEKRSSLLSKLQIPGLTLRRAWLASHILFAGCMFSTIFISSIPLATVMIGFVGISWAMTLWAPFALISAEVSQRDAERRILRREAKLRESSMIVVLPPSSQPPPQHPTLLATDQGDEGLNNTTDLEASGVARGTTIVSSSPPTSYSPYPTKSDPNDEVADRAGVVLGLHNVSVSSPQILSTLISSAIFQLLQKPRGVPWDDSVGWVLRFGGCAALLAAWLTVRLENEERK